MAGSWLAPGQEIVADHDAASGAWVIRSADTELGRLSIKLPTTAEVVLPRERWRLESYGRGWRLALVDADRDLPIAWYEGYRGGFGGRLVIAPDREYRLRSGQPLRRRWRVREGRETLVDVRAKEKGGRDCYGEPRGSWDATVRAVVRCAPSWPSDGLVLTVLAITIAVLELLTPGFPGDGGGG